MTAEDRFSDLIHETRSGDFVPNDTLKLHTESVERDGRIGAQSRSP